MFDDGYEPSPSPQEDWGESDREWVVDGIVGESIDAYEQKRYEVRWGEGWKRADGTNTTWEHPRDDFESLIAEWERAQAARRAEHARERPAVAINVEDWHVLHERRTLEHARGYDELRARYVRGDDPRRPVDFEAQLRRLGPVLRGAQGQGQSEEEDEEDEAQGRGWRDGSVASSQTLGNASSAPSSRGESQEMSRAPGSGASSTAGLFQRPMKPLPGRWAMRRLQPPSPSESDSDMKNDKGKGKERRRRTPPRRESKLSRRRALEKEWAESLDGAAPVTFVNDVNNKEIPPLLPDFQYLERCYVRADGVSAAGHQRESLLSCECRGRCSLYAEDCECQKASGLQDGGGRRIFAYTRKKLFNFKLLPGMGLEVVECNDNCTCDERCHNRVAQLPRDVPIEVFMTRAHGWGARATVAVPRGKVIGVYTGELITREVAEQRHALGDGRKASYIFDLDAHEGSDDSDEESDKDESSERYSVDGYAHGNWTRFINHSCKPNMRVVPVVWDTLPELHQPFLAFVATKDIPARTELTIDYDPKAAFAALHSNGERPLAMPEGTRKCLCETDSCRGWIRV